VCMLAGKTRLIKLSILKPAHFEEDPPQCHTNTLGGGLQLQ